MIFGPLVISLLVNVYFLIASISGSNMSSLVIFGRDALGLNGQLPQQIFLCQYVAPVLSNIFVMDGDVDVFDKACANVAYQLNPTKTAISDLDASSTLSASISAPSSTRKCLQKQSLSPELLYTVVYLTKAAFNILLHITVIALVAAVLHLYYLLNGTLPTSAILATVKYFSIKIWRDYWMVCIQFFALFA
jgi:hypothetical protein